MIHIHEVWNLYGILLHMLDALLSENFHSLYIPWYALQIICK